MKHALRLLGALVMVSLCQAKAPADLQARLDAFAKGEAGGVALVWVDEDGPVYCVSGRFSEKDTRSVTVDTQFELGSVTKVFTALLLAESVRLGKVSLNDPAAKFLLPAGDPAQAALAPITLLSLSTHSAGLPRLPFNIGPLPDSNPDPYAKYDREALIEGLRGHGAFAPVGRSMAYSNFGLAVLGEALGLAWDQSYAQALQFHVLAPLDLKATSVGLVGQAAAGEFAAPHLNGNPVPAWSWQAFAPAGGLRSTARDLGRFLAFCIKPSDTPFASSLRATLQPQRAAEEVGGRMGLGWFLSDDASASLAWHNGATAGSRCFLAFDQKAHRGLAILSGNSKSPDELGFTLLGATAPTPPKIPVQDAAAYEGRYPLSPQFALDITASQGVLHLQATGQPRVRLRPLSADRFAVNGVPAELSFVRDVAGRVVSLVLHQNGSDMPGPRQALPVPPVAITLPVEVLRDYVGSYPLAPSFILRVTEEQGALFVQATGQAKFPVFASARDRFFYKVVDARLRFERDAAGAVFRVVLHQNGRDLPGMKTAN